MTQEEREALAMLLDQAFVKTWAYGQLCDACRTELRSFGPRDHIPDCPLVKVTTALRRVES